MTDVMVLSKTSRSRSVATRSSIVNTSLIVASILGCILSYFIIHPLLIPAEAALNVEYGRLILAGKSPYVDFFDISSPVSMYLACLPNLISTYLPIHPIQSFNLFVWILLVISTLLLSSLLFLSRSREQGVVPYIVIAYAFLNLFLLNQFGSNEHLLIIFSTPYFFSRILSCNGAKVDIRLLALSGAFASIGFCLDPLYLILFVLFETYLVLEKGSFDSLCREDFSACFSMLVIYGFILITALEPVGMNFSKFVYPVMFLDYDSWNNDLVYLGMTPDRRDLVYFMVISMVLGLSFRKWSKIILPMVVISIFGFGIYVIQGKMYTAQAIPMVYGAWFSFACVVGVLLNWFFKLPVALKLSKVRLGTVSVAIVAIVFFVGFVVIKKTEVSHSNYLSLSEQGYIGASPRGDLSYFADFVEANSKVKDQVLVISDQPYPAYPVLLQLGRRPGSGFLATRLLKVARRTRYTRPVEVWRSYVLAEDELYLKLKEDIQKETPSLILVNQDSMGPALEEKLVSNEIMMRYEPVGFLDWRDDAASHPYFEYLGYKTAFHAFKLKKISN